MSELPTPHWAGDNGKKVNVEGSLGIRPVEFEEIEIGQDRVEYTVRDNKMVFHFFKKSGPFPMSFRSRIWNSFRHNMGLAGKENHLSITFEPELNSWCVIIDNIAAIIPPSEETIAATIRDVVVVGG